MSFGFVACLRFVLYLFHLLLKNRRSCQHLSLLLSSVLMPPLDINTTICQTRNEIFIALNTPSSLSTGLPMATSCHHGAVNNTIANTMTGQTVEEILYLANIRSIFDLNEETVGYLTYVLEGRVTLTPFRTSIDEFYAWRAVNPTVRDVEYDASIQRVVIKSTSTGLHETTLTVFEAWLGEWAAEINDTEDTDEFRCYTCASADIRGPYEVSEKQADVGMWKVGDQYPLLVVEVGVNESLRQDRLRWLNGTSNQTTTVILVNITEENRPDPPAENETWGLAPIELYNIDHKNLANHIFNWYRERNIPLVGNHIKYDINVVRPGKRICNAALNVVVPNAVYDLAPRHRMIENLTVTLSNGNPSDLDPEGPRAGLNIRQLTCRLGRAVGRSLPKERASKLAWAFISRRNGGLINCLR